MKNEAGGKPKSFCLPSSTHLLLLENVYRYARALIFYDIQPVPRLKYADESMAQFSQKLPWCQSGEVGLRAGRWCGRAPESICRFLYLFILSDPSLLWFLKAPHMKLDKIEFNFQEELRKLQPASW